MLGLKLSLNTTSRSLRGVARVGMVCSAFAALTLLTGCPPNVMAPPCDSTDCSDGDACTTDTCDDSTGTAVCSNVAVACAGQVCNPADGVCVDCVADTDCDDTLFCTGAETCGADNTCSSAGDPCAAGETCNDATDACDTNCTVDADCPDDATFCNGTESCDLTDPAAGVCVSSGDPCPDDGLFCTGTESCDEATAACVASGDPCATGETCNDTTDACDMGAACTADADCDDGLFCNGTETCDLTDPAAGVCANGTSPCTGTQVCDDTADTCTDVAGQTFSLTTGNDTFTGTADADTFDGQFFLSGATFVMTFGNADSLDGGGSNDTLNVSTNAAGPFTASSLSSIEVIDVSASTANTTLGLANANGVTTLKTSSSSSNVSFTGVQTVPTSYSMTNTGSNLTASISATNALAGTTDALMLSLSSVTAGVFTAGPTAAGSGYETMTVDSMGGVANVLTTLAQGNGNSWATMNAQGAQDLTVTNALPAGVTSFNGSTATGKLSVSLANTTAATTVMGGAADDTLTCSAAQNYTVTGNAGNDTIIYAGNLTGSDSTDCGAGADDIISISDANLVAADARALGLAAASNCEWLRMSTGANSAVDVDAAGAIGQFVYNGGSATVTLTNLLDTDKIKLTTSKSTVTPTAKTPAALNNAANVELNGAAAVVVTALAAGSHEIVNVVSEGTNGNTITTLTAVAGATVNLTGSKDFTTTCAALTVFKGASFTGKLTVTGSGAADTIEGGSGADTITGAVGGDTITGNGGADVFTYTTLTNSLNTALDVLMDFTSGTDKLDVPVPPTSLVPSAGVDVTVLAAVASTGTTTGTLATDIGTANAAAAANAWDQTGDVCIVQITGASVGGTNVFYMIIEQGTAPTAYNAAADAVIQLGGTSSTTFVVADFQ